MNAFNSRSRQSLCMAAALVMVTAPCARAAEPTVEIGASLATLNIGLGDNDATTFGIPSGGFGLLGPGVYASFFVGQHVAIEPQLALIWLSAGGDSGHLLNLVGQVDYFASGTSEDSLYVFGAVGVADVSDSDTTPASFGGGAGYRIVAGGRLTFRIDGRLTHFTDNGGNALNFGVSIGGLFGR